ncbi:hypothetical protein [Ectobacillus ponti]|uniref:Uncharacterized protein n=1 Tax=Ectobacillus ponti TaxID=2961894 RepID=A0AA41XAG5_9BACI|nr:hypothetical protein [Ectobacillus ponti]MCP8970128.1 hypothetical protein [Ectobacillus ponti]
MKIITASICSLLLALYCAQPAMALYSEKPMTTEEVYEAEGFTSFAAATKEFEKRFHAKASLPRSIPFSVQHRYSRVDGKDSRIVYEYLGEQASGNQLQIMVSLKHLGKMEGGYRTSAKDGTAIYVYPSSHPALPTTMYLKKDGLHYYLSLFYQEKKVEEQKLMEIIDSFQGQLHRAA